MDAVKFIKERNRMCNSHSPDCEGCRIDEVKPVVAECCLWIYDNPEKSVSIVEKWSAEHPRKTRQSVFLEQWPNAEVGTDGTSCVCPQKVDVNEPCRCVDGCVKCRREFWMQEVE